MVVVGAADAQSSPDADLIRTLRAQSNEAIARHDVAGIASFLDHEFQITTGNGRLLQGRDAMRAAFDEQFRTFGDARYVRTPEMVTVDDAGTRAFERGSWVGTWTTAEGPLRTGGSYAAHWRKTADGWKIHAELFVTLHCTGAGCTP